MLTHLHIKNFKAWKDTGSIRIAPLTVIFGANSAGKSSLGHLLLGLKQTALLTDRRRALHLGDANSLIDLGMFSDCLYGHDLKSRLEFTLGWKLPNQETLRDSLSPGRSYVGERMQLESILRADARGLPEVERFRYELQDNEGACQLSVEHGFKEGAKSAYLEASPLRLVMKQGRKWPIEAPEKFYRFSEVTLARYQNADSFSQFPLEVERLLSDLTYLGPLRDHPRRTYSWAGDAVPDVGHKGEFAIAALLSATNENRRLNRGYRRKTSKFDTFIAEWLRDMGVIESFSVKPLGKGRKEYEVLIRTHAGAPEVKLTDVGFGISQVLPALIQAFYAPMNSTVWMEQPEIHLHPQVQAELADVFISAIKANENSRPRNVQLIVESHSEHFLNRLQRRVAEGEITPDDVAVYFCRRSDTGAEMEPLRLNMFGEIENWPENFFGDEMADIAGRTLAAIARKKAIS